MNEFNFFTFITTIILSVTAIMFWINYYHQRQDIRYLDTRITCLERSEYYAGPGLCSKWKFVEETPAEHLKFCKEHQVVNHRGVFGC